MAKNKKKSALPVVGIVLYILMGVVCGFLFIKYLDKAHLTDMQELLSFVLMIAAMYAAILLQIIIHEAGHLVFGLLSGYKFSSFRIFGWMIQKSRGKKEWKKFSLAGTGGQCLMAPPDLKDGKMPVMLYNFGGAIMNVISAALFLGLSFLLQEPSFLKVFLQFLVVTGIPFAVMNGVPMRMGPVDNDGKNALNLARDPEAARAFWIQLKANAEMAEGKRIREMPEEWFIMPSEEGMQNGITSSVGTLVCSRLMDEHRFAEAEERMAQILSGENGIPGLSKALMVCDRMYAEMIADRRETVIAGMRTKEQLKIMKAMAKYPAVLRTEYAYALLMDQDREKAGKIRTQFEKMAASYPYPGEISSEKEYMEIADRAAEAAGSLE